MEEEEEEGDGGWGMEQPTPHNTEDGEVVLPLPNTDLCIYYAHIPRSATNNMSVLLTATNKSIAGLPHYDNDLNGNPILCENMKDFVLLLNRAPQEYIYSKLYRQFLSEPFLKMPCID